MPKLVRRDQLCAGLTRHYKWPMYCYCWPIACTHNYYTRCYLCPSGCSHKRHKPSSPLQLTSPRQP